MTGTPRPDPRVGTELGPYHVERVVGRGGMGVVYLATHEGLQRKVALKLLAPDYADDEAFRARFLRESRMAAAIDHPNIIPIYDAGEVGGAYFLAMRYVEGTDLEALIEAGPLPPRAALGILVQLAGALDAAHAAGLVHRDVKPANVLLAAGGRGGAYHAYLTDFGLTKHRGSETGLTQGGAFLGTLDYIAPEQVEGKPVDGRADQYALACLAFHGLTGRVPFPRETDIAIAMAHLRDAPPSAVALRPELPAAVDRVIARGMAKRPDDRYPDCATLVDDLRDALGPAADLPARPAGERRPPLLAAAALGLVLLFLAGGLLVAFGTGALDRHTAAPGMTGSPRPAGSTAGGASPTANVEPFVVPTAPSDPFPNPAEEGLIGALGNAPEEIVSTCRRGSYAVGGNLAHRGVPVASVACAEDISTGASELLAREFRPQPQELSLAMWIRSRAMGSGGGFDGAVPEGDCAITAQAVGAWSVADEERGAVACYIEKATGDAILYWSDGSRLLEARNPRGDSAALYDFFERNARFIGP